MLILILISVEGKDKFSIFINLVKIIVLFKKNIIIMFFIENNILSSIL